jgi:hypothetical protein
MATAKKFTLKASYLFQLSTFTAQKLQAETNMPGRATHPVNQTSIHNTSILIRTHE